MDKQKIIEKLMVDFSYTKQELEKFEWIEIEADQAMFENVFFDGSYVLFAEDKVIWY